MQLGSPHIHDDIARGHHADVLEEARRAHLAAQAAGAERPRGLLTALRVLLSSRRERQIAAEEPESAEAPIV